MFDSSVAIGSCNMTHGGIENNIEHMVLFSPVNERKTPEVVKEMMRHFEETWLSSTVIGEDEITEMVIVGQKRQNKKGSRENVDSLTESEGIG